MSGVGTAAPKWRRTRALVADDRGDRAKAPWVCVDVGRSSFAHIAHHVGIYPLARRAKGASHVRYDIIRYNCASCAASCCRGNLIIVCRGR
eukprot:3086503-Prymnesium_polylepis.1